MMTCQNMKKILCIDDDPVFTELYREILGPKGYDVVTASGPEEGYTQAKESSPSAILLDVMMPESGTFRDGFDLLERLRAEDGTKETPIIMISAIGGRHDEEHGMELGANDYIPKQEMTPDLLAKKLEQHCK